MRVLLFDKLEEAHTRSKSGKLDIIIVSGVAGGTSGGILTDLTYNIRATSVLRSGMMCVWVPAC